MIASVRTTGGEAIKVVALATITCDVTSHLQTIGGHAKDSVTKDMQQHNKIHTCYWE